MAHTILGIQTLYSVVCHVRSEVFDAGCSNILHRGERDVSFNELVVCYSEPLILANETMMLDGPTL